jgi:hypothetical protein
MQKVKVIDAVMGTGKTRFAISRIIKAQNRIIFITPYLDEIDRVISECKKAGRTVHTPAENKDGTTKSKDLLRLVLEGKSIASTHSLFKKLDRETIEALRHNQYTLILDEVLEVLAPIQVKPKAIEEMIRLKVLKLVDSEVESVKHVQPGDYTGLNGADADIRLSGIPNEDIHLWADTGRLVWVNNTALLWIWPSEIMSVFKEVLCLTFLFKGSQIQAFYEIHGIDYEVHSLEVQKRGRGVSYKMVPYQADLDADFCKRMKALCHIYEGNMNTVGKNGYALSFNWWRKLAGKPKQGGKVVKHVQSFLRMNRGNSAMFTCFKKDVFRFKGDAEWVPHNQRATNRLRHKEVVAYTVNRFMNSVTKSYFEAFNFHPEEDRYALSELLQFLFRSRLRLGKSVQIYIPSSRMRTLLKAFLAGGSLEADMEVKTIT